MTLRSSLLVAALLVSACASNPANVIPAGAKPIWADLNPDLRFPKTKFVVGVATLPISSDAKPDFVEQLDAAARKELAKTLQVDVSSQVQTYQSSVSVNGAHNNVSVMQASASEAVDLQLSGVQIVERWRDVAGSAAYALAVLEREPTAAKLKSQIQSQMQSADDYLGKGDAALPGDPGAALHAYLRARHEADGALSKHLLLRALTTDTGDAPAVAKYDGKLTSILSSISLAAVEGDGVRATAGKPLARPVVLKAEYRGTGDAKPLPGLTFTFTLEGGQVDGHVTTGPDGLAKANVSNAGELSSANAKVVAAVDWAALASAAGIASTKGVPAWLTGVKVQDVSFRLVAKSLHATRVLVKIIETIEEGSPVKESSVESALSAELTKAGFSVADPKAFVDAIGGADKIATIKDDELKSKARGLADVIVIGTATSKFNKKFAGAVIFHRARGVIRAVDVNEGKVLSTVDKDIPADKFGQGPDKAGAVALQNLGTKIGPELAQSLKMGMGL